MERLARLVAVVGLLACASAGTTVYEVYRVQPKDTVDHIASRFGMSADELRALNPHLQTSTLTPNELLTVMIRGDGDAMPPSGAVSRAATLGMGAPAGSNSASGIRRPGAPKVADLGSEQALAPPDVVAGSAEVSAPELPTISNIRPDLHPVQRGESLSAISARYHMTVEEVVALNPLLLVQSAFECGVLQIVPPAHVEAPSAGQLGRDASPDFVDVAATRWRPGDLLNAEYVGEPHVDVPQQAVTFDRSHGSDGFMTRPFEARPAAERTPQPSLVSLPIDNVVPDDTLPTGRDGVGADRVFAGNGVVGLLGNASAGACIYTQADRNTTRRFVCSGSEQLVVIKQVGDWYGIGMSDGSTGWIETSGVELTSTELVPMGEASTGQGVWDPPVLRRGHTRWPCAVYALPSKESPLLGRCTSDQRLAIIHVAKDWYAVIMSDGSPGWVHAGNVKLERRR